MAKTCKPILEYQETIKNTGIKIEANTKPTKKAMRNFIRLFKSVKDIRIQNMITYPLVEILVIAFLAVLGGSEGWADIHNFGLDKIKWLKKFLKLKNGIPSHDTFKRVFSLINPEMLERVTVAFLCENMDKIKHAFNLDSDAKRHICVDGKEQNGTGRNYGTPDVIRNLQTLHVYDASNAICLFSKAIDSKTNEIPVAQEILKTINLHNAVVTFDALHTQKKTIEIIASNKGDYVAALKGNQQTFFEEVRLFFSDECKEEIKNSGRNYCTTFEKAHNQIETRNFYLSTSINWFQDRKNWSKLKAFICYEKIVINSKTNKETSETRYYITNLDDIELCADAIRGHWSIENNLHWHLDVTLSEDDNTTMDKNAFNNLSLMRKMALSLYKITKPILSKTSIRQTKLSYGRDIESSVSLLFSALDEDTLSLALAEANERNSKKSK